MLYKTSRLQAMSTLDYAITVYCMCMNSYNIVQALTGYQYAVWTSDSKRSVFRGLANQPDLVSIQFTNKDTHYGMQKQTVEVLGH